MSSQKPAPSPLQQAFFVIRDLESKVAALTSEPIAIVGMACRFPGGSNTPEAFWDLLEKGRDGVVDVPADRWDVDAYFDSNPDAPGKMYTRQAGFLGPIDQFDARFFGISPREAIHMDPQQRLLLEVSWEALERAGVAPGGLSETRTGVFVGASPSDYAQLHFHAGDPSVIDVYDGTGNASCFTAGRLSYVLGVQGPSLMVDTACSSSLVAVHLACRSLRSGECDVALAGGVQLMVTPETFLFLSRARALAPDGRCKPFDASANGYGRGEGCGVVVLKRLSAAQAAGDRILAVIRGSAVNHDGPSSGLTVPNGRAQQALLRSALETAGVSPTDVGYVEAHGTGTSLGDPIEADALAAVLGAGRSPQKPLWIGSVKSNIGHLESAAGIAGLMKAVLTLKHRTVPPSLHFSRPNPHIAWDELPLRVPTAPVAWEENGKPRIAGVSSFGLSGTNAHIVLEEAPSTESPAVASAEGPRVLPLSGRSPSALEALASSWSEALKSPALEGSLEAIAYTAGVRRTQHEHRLAVIGSTRAEWAAGLEAFLRGAAHPGLVSGHAEPGAPAKVVFIFPGQGSQWIGMGRELMASEPVFHEALTACAEAFRPYAQFSLLEVLQGSDTAQLERIDVIQPVLFAIEVGLAKLWRSWGVEPAAVVGHSMGEVAAAHIAGALSLEDAARVICERSKLMLRLRGAGAMAVVELPADEAEAALGSEKGRVSIAASNSPGSTVLSGDTAAIDALVKRFEALGVFARRVKVDVASHSSQVDPILEELRGKLASLQPRPGTLPLFSTVTRERADGASFDAGYWVRNLRDPVHFSHAIQSLQQSGHTLFLEISPHPILLASVEQTLKGNTAARVLPSLRRERPERSSLLESLATLYTRGYALDWRKLHSAPLPAVGMPTYPWQRERLWVSRPARQGTAVDVDTSAVRPLAGDRLLTPGEEIHFVRKVSGVDMPYLEDHRVFGEVVVPGAFHLATLLSVADELVGPGGCVVEALAFAQALVLAEQEAPSVHLTAMPVGDGRMRIRRASLAPQQGRAGTWRDHATATLAPLGSARAPDAPVRPGLELASKQVSEADTAAFYAGVSLRGIELGPSFRWIRKLWVGPGESLALLEAPASLQGPKLPVHPARMDAVFQAFAAAVPDSSTTTFVPFGLERLVFHGAPEGAWWCHATCRPEQGGELWTGEVRLYAEDGRAIAHIEGLRMKRASREAFLQRSGDKPVWADWLFEQRWERQSAPAAASAPTSPGRWLLFADRHGVATGLAAKLTALGETCVTVTPGLRFERSNDTAYTVALESAGDFPRVLAAAQEGGPLRGVVFLWGLDCEPPTEKGLAWLADAEARGCGGLLHVVQALASGSFRNPPRLTVVTRGAQSLSGEGSVLAAQTMLWGMARSLAYEQDAFGLARIDLDPSGDAGVLDALARELVVPDGEEEVLLRGSDRYMGRFSRCAELGTSSTELRIREDASYLITGGLGGLGLSVARWLVGRGARQLVLVARGGARTPEQHEALAALKELGAEATVVQADVADPAQLSHALNEAGKRAPLRGVIHAAGVLDDGFVAQQTVERLRRVMAPKAAGAWNLHTLTQDLDFFVLYSSAASLVGSPGQSNYGAANAFLDGLAWHRRSLGLPALSLNWGAFSEVGLAAQQENRGERLGKRGFGAISPEVGLEALAGLLQSRLTQVAVTPLDARQWLEFYPQLASSKRFSESVREARRTRRATADGATLESLRAAAPKERLGMIERLIREQVAQVLRLEPSSIERQTPFKTLGFDSLMGLELRNRLETTLGLTLSATLVWTYPTLEALAPHLVDKLGLSQSAEPPTSEPSPEPATTSLDHLSDTEAEALLEEKLASLMKRL